MSEEEPGAMTPEEMAAQEAAAMAAAMLADAKKTAIERFVSHMNAVGASIVQQYPMAEVQSWPIQKVEAEALLALEAPDLPAASAVAPFLLSVTEVHFGPAADDAERLAQLQDKAAAVKANADAWAALSAYVNGLRARVSDRIEAAENMDALFVIQSEAATELSEWREAAGV
jgi:hypothetical protein